MYKWTDSRVRQAQVRAVDLEGRKSAKIRELKVGLPCFVFRLCFVSGGVGAGGSQAPIFLLSAAGRLGGPLPKGVTNAAQV